MTPMFQLLGSFTTLAFIAYAIAHRDNEDLNNWYRLAMAGFGIGSAIAAFLAFPSVQAASSAQLFSFLVNCAGSVMGAMYGASLRPGRWEVTGLLPQWERRPGQDK